ncbi:alpha-D-ribose 1-methylphosphonate 5-triphosphate synthase subunit PhnL [Stella humosa]|uniref:Alpha-D-ribose 1-methylphosphonate 5-triphosphate synthase subunit PhnL n=1 Tax=Stella humosa TaxID=94 RepID=A0A3N1MEP7_9PROT|nr:phosphonate C-P lyase system protein PhnL [Stella humosa]ROQ01769.1 alpha-D-ribose 1-methylphosphonate 5-triphosphate synthase subunit PhnL [Stella humosa]BBK32153.1 phosphonate C-P lyase system protein PhnL [Stella humosa]
MTANPEFALSIAGLSKRFTLHVQGGVVLAVLNGIDLQVAAGECVALNGPSGAGKSSLLRLVYGNYRAQGGSIRVRHRGEPVDIATATPQKILELRRHTLGYVSQFLRVIPRVPAIDVVAEPARAVGMRAAEAEQRAQRLLSRLRIPERLWSLPPATFSGGEQQRINLARGFVVDFPVLLLDEPTAALDADNRRTVVTLIGEAKARGAALLGIFHDAEVRDAVADRTVAMRAPIMAA